MGKIKKLKEKLNKACKKLDATTEWKKRNSLALKTSKLHGKLMKLEEKKREKEFKTGKTRFRSVAIGQR